MGRFISEQNEIRARARKMALQVKVLIVKADDLCSIPRIHIVEGERSFHKAAL